MVFVCYSKEETFEHPLETLLLVCRFWNHTAVEHRSIWTNLRIYLGHQPTSRAWTMRLPLRLTRCGPNSLLDIDLRNLLDAPEYEEIMEISDKSDVFQTHSCPLASDPMFFGRCTCYKEVRECVDNALQVLSGQYGNTCARWRSLILDLGHDEEEDSWTGNQHLVDALRHPTPMLTAMTLRRVRLGAEYFSSELFPITTLVKELSIIDCHLPSLPNFETVIASILGWKEPYTSYQDLASFRGAAKIRRLALLTGYSSDIGLPLEMPDLRVLEIDGITVPQDLMKSKTPQLINLALHFDFRNLIAQILLAEGIPFEKITRITLYWDNSIRDAPSEDEFLDVLYSAKELMESLVSLELLGTSGDMLSIILKILWDSTDANLPSEEAKTFVPHKLILHNMMTEESIKIGEVMRQGGQQTRLALECLAECRGLAPLDLFEEEFAAFLFTQVS